MPDPVSERLSALPLLEKQALVELWAELFAKSPPPKLRRDFMIPILAHRLQEEAFGALRLAARKRLDQLARAFTARTDASFAQTSHLRPGTRLVRQWGNRVHVVNVESSAYEYQGVRYQSLSHIARVITGTRWSGPLFFGVKRKGKARGKQEAK